MVFITTINATAGLVGEERVAQFRIVLTTAMDTGFAKVVTVCANPGSAVLDAQRLIAYTTALIEGIALRASVFAPLDSRDHFAKTLFAVRIQSAEGTVSVTMVCVCALAVGVALPAMLLSVSPIVIMADATTGFVSVRMVTVAPPARSRRASNAAPTTVFARTMFATASKDTVERIARFPVPTRRNCSSVTQSSLTLTTTRLECSQRLTLGPLA